MKRIILMCAGVVLLFGIGSISFAAGMGDEMTGKTGTMKEEGMKKTEEAMGDMKGKGEEMSSDAKGEEMSGNIKAQGKEKMGKMKKKSMKEESMEK